MRARLIGFGWKGDGEFLRKGRTPSIQDQRKKIKQNWRGMKEKLGAWGVRNDRSYKRHKPCWV